MEFKQVIIVREDLNLSKGKLAVEVAHASLEAFLKSNENTREKWINNGAKKVVLKVKNKNELIKIFENAKSLKLPVSLIKDAGFTEIEPGTITAVGIGPGESKKIDKVTASLPLLK